MPEGRLARTRDAYLARPRLARRCCGNVFCPYWSVEPMCDCEVCRDQIRQQTHISQTCANAAM